MKIGFKALDSDMHVYDPASQLEAIEGKGLEAQKKILWDNCARLYGLA